LTVTTDYRRQKDARATLNRLFANGANTLVIHYSCESFYDRPDGASPRITSIAVRRLDTGQTVSFSIHQVAERNKHPLDDIDRMYDAFERQMLDEYFEYVDRHREQNWLHWNMRDINYGFAALEHRYRVLGGAPVEIHESRRFDLSRLLVAIYGNAYIGHPRLDRLVEKNNITRKAFMTGKEEADAFVNKNYVGLHQSTLRKVDVLANVAGRAQDRSLKTNTSWWNLHGGSVKGVADWLATHPAFTIFGVLTTVAGTALAIVALK
jgi:hypothetical protein